MKYLHIYPRSVILNIMRSGLKMLILSGAAAMALAGPAWAGTEDCRAGGPGDDWDYVCFSQDGDMDWPEESQPGWTDSSDTVVDGSDPEESLVEPTAPRVYPIMRRGSSPVKNKTKPPGKHSTKKQAVPNKKKQKTKSSKKKRR